GGGGGWAASWSGRRGGRSRPPPRVTRPRTSCTCSPCTARCTCSATTTPSPTRSARCSSCRPGCCRAGVPGGGPADTVYPSSSLAAAAAGLPDVQLLIYALVLVLLAGLVAMTDAPLAPVSQAPAAGAGAGG